MRSATGVVAGVGEVRGVAVVHRHTGEAGENPHGVHGLGAPVLVALDQGEGRRGDGVEPVRHPRDAGFGLIGTDHLGGAKVASQSLQEPRLLQQRLGPGQQPRQPPRRHRRPEGLLHEFCGTGYGDVLVGEQVAGEGGHVGSPAGGPGSLRRELPGAECPAGATAVLQHPLGDRDPELGKVEDLAALTLLHRGVGKACSAILAGRRARDHNDVRGVDLGKVATGGAGLLARLALALLFLPALPAGGLGGSLGEGVGGRRLGGVVGVPGELSLQLVDLGLHALDEHPKARRQAAELLGQFRLRGRELAEEVVHPRQQVAGSRAGGHIMLLHRRVR